MSIPNTYFKTEGDQIIFSIPKDKLPDHFIQQIIEWLRVQQILDKSEMTEEQAWELSEQVKEEYWDKLKDQFGKSE